MLGFPAHGCQSNLTRIVDANIVVARVEQPSIVVAEVLVARVEIATIVISDIAVASVGVADIVVAAVLIACVGIACTPTGDALWPLDESLNVGTIVLRVMSVLCGVNVMSRCAYATA